MHQQLWPKTADLEPCWPLREPVFILLHPECIDARRPVIWISESLECKVLRIFFFFFQEQVWSLNAWLLWTSAFCEPETYSATCVVRFLNAWLLWTDLFYIIYIHISLSFINTNLIPGVKVQQVLIALLGHQLVPDLLVCNLDLSPLAADVRLSRVGLVSFADLE